MQGQTLKERRSSRKKASPLPSLPISTASPSWNLTLSERKQRVWRIVVTSQLGCPFRFRAITTLLSRMLEKDSSFFNVISTASLWDLRLWLQWCEGMWACVRIEYIIVNVFSHSTYYNALFIVFFSQVSSPDEGSETHGPKQATSGSITGRPGAIRWRLTTRVSHLIVSETLCLSSTAT